MQNFLYKLNLRKSLFYFAYFILLSLFFIFHPKLLFGNEALLYVIIEITAAVTALIIGILTILRYYAKKQNILLFIGAGLIGESIIDSYNFIAASSFFSDFFSPLQLSFSYWNWTASRLFLCSILLLSLYGSLKEQIPNNKQLNEKSISIIVSLFLVVNLIIFSLIPFEFSFLYIIQHIFQHIIPQFLFLIVTIGYLKRGQWINDSFEYWFVFFLITNVVIEILFIPNSTNLFDSIYFYSHFLKIISFLLIFIGFIMSTYRLFNEMENTKNLFVTQNLSLNQTRVELENALKTSILKETELNSKISDLESTKKALYNVLDDLNKEKAKVEEAKVKDEAILTSIGEGMIATDRQGHVIMINTQTEIMLGLKSRDVIGKKWIESTSMIDIRDNLLPPEKRPIQISLFTGRKIFETSCSYLKADKSKFPVAITTSPIVLNNKIIGAIMVFRDITREKEVDRMKTEFISLASHQLRTPLSAIKWFSEMLINGDAGELNQEQHEFVQNINLSTERMIELVNSLLNISRIESGRIIIDPKPTDLRELLQEVLQEVKIKSDQKQQKIVLDLEKELPKISIDPKLIREVYLNLLTNAIKYTPNHGEIFLNIFKDNYQIISQIRDTGYGIPKTEFDKVFKKFYRGTNIIKVETEGTGLGLYLVKSIINSSQGNIWFDSKEGQGTTFWFSLPLSGTPAKEGEVALDTQNPAFI